MWLMLLFFLMNVSQYSKNLKKIKLINSIYKNLDAFFKALQKIISIEFIFGFLILIMLFTYGSYKLYSATN